MIKHFSCGHSRTVQNYKDSRRINLSFPCDACRFKDAVNIEASVEMVKLGNKTVALKLRAHVAKR
jgi:hypothetical protein